MNMNENWGIPKVVEILLLSINYTLKYVNQQSIKIILWGNGKIAQQLQELGCSYGGLRRNS